MALRDYLEILWRRRLLVLLPVLAAAALAAGPALIQPPAYRSTATLFFAPRDPSQGTALAGQRLASYVELVSGPRLAQGVAQQLGLPQDKAAVDDLERRVTATAQPDSLLVTVAATGASAQDSQRLAQAAAAQLIQLAASLEPPATATQTSPTWLTIAEPAEPGVPLGRSTLMQDVVLALVLGLAVGGALAFLADAVDPRVVDARGLRRIVPGSVLTLAVPRAAGGEGTPQGEAVPPPGAVRVLRTALLGRALPDAAGARVLLVTGASAGAETGTVASWIATALGRSGRKVLLVRTAAAEALQDGPQGGDEDAAPGQAAGIVQLLAGEVTLDELAAGDRDGGPLVLSLGRNAGDPGDVLAAPGMAELVRQLSERFDHVVIEAPPVLPYVETALLAAQSADQVVLVVRPGWSRRRQVRSAVAVLAQQQAPVTVSVLTRRVRRRAGGAAEAELPTRVHTDVASTDTAPPVVAPLPTDPVLEEQLVSGDGEAADQAEADDAPAGDELDDALEGELDEDRPVLSGGGPARGGDA